MIRYSEQEKQTHLALWVESGLSKRAYSESSGLKYWTFLRWSHAAHARIVAPESKQKEHFIPVSLSGDTDLHGLIEVCYPSGIIVKLPGTTSIRVLKDLLS